MIFLEASDDDSSAGSARRATAIPSRPRERRAGQHRRGAPASRADPRAGRPRGRHVGLLDRPAEGPDLWSLRSAPATTNELGIDIVTFGFKYGIPLEADLVFDVRFLTNPYWDPELKPLSGKETKVRDFVLAAADRESLPRARHRAPDAHRPGVSRRGQGSAADRARLHRRLPPLDRPGRGARASDSRRCRT